MLPTAEPQQNQLRVSQPITTQNSPLAYGLGSFGLASLGTVFVGFYMFYYIDVLGLAVTLAAIINIIYAIWDAVNDPLAGFLSDNTRTRWGRRKPWLLTGLPFYIGGLVLVYAVPKPFLQENVLFWYALVMFLLFEAASTVMWVN
jgi:glycoside/pentoside/hexuronide:cation symporter, GPH family